MLSEIEIYILKVDTILKLNGWSIDRNDSYRNLLERLRYHWQSCFHLFLANVSAGLEAMWLVLNFKKNLLEVVMVLPCFALILLSDFRFCSFIYNIHRINDVTKILMKLENTKKPFKDKDIDNIKDKWLKILTNTIKLLVYVSTSGIFAFILMPFIIMASNYYTSGQTKLLLPFLCWYPFDESDKYYWPFAFIQQFWTAWTVVYGVVGPDCFFFTCCTFIHLQFIYLHKELELIIKEDSWRHKNYNTEGFQIKISRLVKRHRDLIRCVELLNSVYSKSMLFNVVTSSLIICAAGFTATASHDFVLMIPFCAFFIFGMLQVNLYCYFGDYVMRSSMLVADGVYNSRWYDTGVTENKYLFIMLLRSQTPCKFTAYGFTDINLKTSTRILSKSWSYFALLNTMYRNMKN